MPRGPIAARFCRWTRKPLSRPVAAASWSTACRRFDATRSSCPHRRWSCSTATWCGSSGRAALRRLGQATKKGLLFYGPPGTGKTHTIHYLAGQLPGHTTFLITAEQVGLLGEYMTLARLFQPAWW